MKTLVLSVLIAITPLAAFAQDTGTQSMKDAMALYESMSPEQKALVKQQAERYQRELKAMSPAERQALTNQAKAAGATVDINKVDPNKLDTDNMPSLKENRDNLYEYQDKHKAGKLKNAVLKK